MDNYWYNYFNSMSKKKNFIQIYSLLMNCNEVSYKIFLFWFSNLIPKIPIVLIPLSSKLNFYLGNNDNTNKAPTWEPCDKQSIN